MLDETFKRKRTRWERRTRQLSVISDQASRVNDKESEIVVKKTNENDKKQSLQRRDHVQHVSVLVDADTVLADI